MGAEESSPIAPRDRGETSAQKSFSEERGINGSKDQAALEVDDLAWREEFGDQEVINSSQANQSLNEGSNWRSVTPDVSWLNDATAREGLLKHLLGDEAQARQAFDDVWTCCRPERDGMVPRIRIHEVLVHAARQIAESPSKSAQVNRHLGRALGGSSQSIAFEDAFQTTRTALRSLPGIEEYEGTGQPSGIEQNDGTRQPSGIEQNDWTRRPSGSMDSSSLIPPMPESRSRESRGISAVDRTKPRPPNPAFARVEPKSKEMELPYARRVSIEYAVRRRSVLDFMSGDAESRVQEATRADLETDHARLSAQISAAQARNRELGNVVEELRLEVFGDKYKQVRKLQANLDEQAARLEELAVERDEQNQEMMRLMSDCTHWVLQAGETRKYRDDVRADCENILQEAEDMERQLVAEQLRVFMLRNAYEGEQTSFDSSVDVAAMMLNHKFAQNTQDFEREEQQAQQELATRAQDETLGVESDQKAAQKQEEEILEEIDAIVSLAEAVHERRIAAAYSREQSAKALFLRNSLTGLQVRLNHQPAGNGLPVQDDRDRRHAVLRQRLLTEEAALSNAEARLSETVSEAAAVAAATEAAAQLAKWHNTETEQVHVPMEIKRLELELGAMLGLEAVTQCRLAEEELALRGISALSPQ